MNEHKTVRLVLAIFIGAFALAFLCKAIYYVTSVRGEQSDRLAACYFGISVLMALISGKLISLVKKADQK